jgi:hypothetical protein
MGACRSLAGLVIGLSLALGLAACGGDNDPAGEPPTTAPPEPADTRPASPGEANFPADFTNQVDQVCAKAKSEIDKLVSTEVRDPEQLQQLSEVHKNTATELEGLKPPADNAAAYQEFTDAWRDGEDLFARLQAEVGRGDSSAYQRVNSTLDQVKTDVRDVATEYGFQECAAD